MKIVKKTIDLGDGRTITIETGKLAKQADGSVEVRMGNTMLLATVVQRKIFGHRPFPRRIHPSRRTCFGL